MEEVTDLSTATTLDMQLDDAVAELQTLEQKFEAVLSALRQMPAGLHYSITVHDAQLERLVAARDPAGQRDITVDGTKHHPSYTFSSTRVPFGSGSIAFIGAPVEEGRK